MKSTLEGLDRISEDPENLPNSDQYIQVSTILDNITVLTICRRNKKFNVVFLRRGGVHSNFVVWICTMHASLDVDNFSFPPRPTER